MTVMNISICRSLRSVSVLVALAAVGCGGDPTPAVSGKITYRGSPLPLGTVMFVGDDGNGRDAILRNDGTYSIRPAPVGKMKVVITGGKPPPGAGGESFIGPDVTVPAKYTKPETTDLTVELKPGPNEFSYDIP